MRACLLTTALLAALAVGFAPAPFPKTSRGREQHQSIFGRWDFVTWEMNGRKSPASQYLEFTSDKVDFVSIQGGGKVTYKLTLRDDLSPRGFHWDAGGSGWIGSYRVQGDTLTLIFKSGKAFEDRPVNFGATHEYLFVLKRKR